jgi:hypothetical protein
MQRTSGEAVTVARRVPLTGAQVRRVRDRQMYAMKLRGSTTREIAAFFSFSRQYVNRCLRSIPEAERRRVERLAACGP